MHWFVLFSLISRLWASSFEEVVPSAPEEIASMNTDLLVDGFVSVVSGQLSLVETDLHVKGAQDLILQRTYIAPQIFGRYDDKEEGDRFALGKALGQLYAKGWVVLPHIVAGYNRNSPYFQVRDSQGAVLEFQMIGNQGYLKTSGYGCSNLRGEEPTAEADIRNIQLWIEGTQVKVIWPNGIQRVYQSQSANLYRLEYELLPNGKAIRYSYDNQRLARISSTDISGKYIYATIDKIEDQHYKGSDGREARLFYEMREIKGQFKKKHYKETASFKFPILTSTSNPTYLNTAIYNDRTLLISYDTKNFPISCTYNQQKASLCRIQSFSTPSNTTYFSYDPPVVGQKGGSTTVIHANGSQTIYYFNSNFLLSSIENWFEGKLYNQKLFFYDRKQHICKIETKDGQGNLLLAKIYECDLMGNPITEKWEGDFGVFSIQRVFLKNRIIQEEYSDGLGFEYTYLGDTHLLTSKKTRSHGQPIRKTEYTYDDAYNLIEEREVDKTMTTYILYQEEPHLHRTQWKIEKDWEGNLIHKTRFTYDRFSNLSEEDHYGNDGQFVYKTTKTYDSHDLLLEETNPLGQTASYTYDSRARRTKEIPFSHNKIIQRTFDAKGRLTTLQEGGHTSHFVYNSVDQLIQETDYLGLETHYRYHPVHGKPIRIEKEPVLLQITYDDFGREIEKKDAYGATTTIQPNSYGDPSVIIHPDGGKEVFHYAPNRTLLSRVDPDNIATFYTYDPLKRILSKTVGTRKSTYAYDAYNLLAEKDPLRTTYYQYNLAGQKIQEIRGSRAVRFSYDPLGFLSKKENGSRNIFYQNDVLGRVITESIDGRLNLSYTYDSAGNIGSITQQETICYFFYDPYNRLIEKIKADGTKTSISYEEGDKLLVKTIKDPKERTEIYNAHGLLLKKEIADCIVEEYSYDKALRLSAQDHITFTYTPEGFRSSLTEAGRKTTSWTYTPGGKVQSKAKPDGSKLLYEYTTEGDLARVGSREFQYDALGRIIGGTGFSREYDLFDNVIKEEFTTGLSIITSYDDSDRPTERILPNQSRILYEYEGPFLVKVSRMSLSGDLLYTHTYDQFDLNGHLLSETGLFTSTYQYDQMGRRMFQRNPFFIENLSYDESGNLIRTGGLSYTYDAADQLISSVGQFDLHYDKHYNRIAKNSDSFAIDPLNQIENFSYDANGNFTQNGFLFDEFDQLVQTSEETIVYDALGRRLQKGAISYLYFGDEEIGAFEQGRPKELKIPGLFAPIALEIDNKPYYPIIDVQGTIRRLIDPETFTVCRENRCDPFGAGLTSEIPYAYVGKRYDAQSGLIYFGKRYYIPTLGRWLTPDPIGPIDHSNLYQYLFNNPFRYQDPNGESIGGYLLGIGEIVLGGTLIVTGGVLEIVTFGGYTIGCGFQIGAGMALIGDGLVRTTMEARDTPLISTSANRERRSSDEPDSPPYRGDKLGTDPGKPPEDGFEWRGVGSPGSKQGSWVKGNKKDGNLQSLRPDFDHPKPIGSHWDYKGREVPNGARLFPDGTWEPK